MTDNTEKKKLSTAHKFGLLIVVKLVIIVVAVVFFLKYKGLI